MYEVSNLGRVVSLPREVTATAFGTTRVTKRHEKVAFLKPNGYMCVFLYRNGKGNPRYVHRLVADAFLPNPEGKKTVNHKDSKRDHNVLTNLEWATHGENNLHAAAAGRMMFRGGPKVVIQMTLEGDFVAGYRSAVDAAKATGVKRSQIAECCKPYRKGSGYTAGGFRWRFA